MKTRTVYLLHIEPPFKHAQHYLGVVRAGRHVPLRWIEHMRRRGAKLTIHARRAGSTLILTRIWRNADFALERRLKGRSLKPLCPKCRKAKNETHTG